MKTVKSDILYGVESTEFVGPVVATLVLCTENVVKLASALNKLMETKTDDDNKASVNVALNDLERVIVTTQPELEEDSKNKKPFA